MSHVYTGAAWQELAEWWAYDGGDWRDIQEAWSYDGGTWRKVFEVSAGCVCGSASITYFGETDDVASCQCRVSKFNQQLVTVRWDFADAQEQCHHIRVERSSNGSSYYTYTSNLDLTSQTGCSTSRDGCYTTSCVAHLYYWRVKLELDSDNTICDTSSSSRANDCIA